MKTRTAAAFALASTEPGLGGRERVAGRGIGEGDSLTASTEPGLGGRERVGSALEPIDRV